MAAQDGLTFEGTFNNVTTGLYKDNTTNDISEADLRALPTAIRESYLNRLDDAYTAIFPQFTTATSTTAYTGTPSPVITAYATGQKFQVKIHATSTGAATLNLNSIGSKKVFVNPTTQATTGDLLINQIYIFAYDAALDTAAGGFLMIGSGGGEDAWLVTGTTSVNAPVINTGVTDLSILGGTADGTGISVAGSTDSVVLVASGGTTVDIDPSIFQVQGGTSITLTATAGLTLNSTAATLGGEDVNINAGNTGSNKDINLSSPNGHTHISTGGTTRFLIQSTGSLEIDRTVIGAGTTGAQTINKMAGIVNFAAGASTLVVTNSLATTSSIIIVQVLGVDTTPKFAVVTRASGSFTITLNAVAVAELPVAFWLTN